MKAKKYKIMEIRDASDSKHGKIWMIKANPVEENPFNGARFFTSYIYEETELFLIPYNNPFVDEIEDIARSGKIWTPNKNDWQEEVSFNEDIGQKCVINRFKETHKENSNKRLVFSNKKTLKQFVLEQNAEVKTFKSSKSDKLFFECGKIRGYVSPAAAERLKDPNCSIDDFNFAMVAKEGEEPIPCIIIANKHFEGSIEQQKLSPKDQFATTYQTLLKTIEENYAIENTDDFDMIDASFVFDVLDLLQIQHGKTLGFYRRQDDIVDRSFVASPYVHNTNADKVYNPIIIPKKKTLFQRLGMSSEPYKEGDFTISESYSTEYLLRGIVDRRVLKDIYGGSNLRIDQYISLPIKEEAVWQMFLLDNIEYFLPKFDHGVYKDRKLIFTSNDTKDLPASIQQYVQRNDNKINPIIQINEAEELASVQCTYFNKWRGLVKWTCYYHLFGGHDKSLIRMSHIKHMETNDILVKYDCGIRY
ncbi:MAG: hypothetical protein K6A94_06870 [Bacteroidales bacterium]|nr:hypothetical protein [Bacteroidales bacterium]